MYLRKFSALFLALGLVSCGTDFDKDEMETAPSEDRYNSGMGKFLGDEALTFGGPKKREQEDTGLGVNSYLWRASLDTISFMPLASADPFGGVIITEWFTPPQNPQERLKMNVYILDRQLRSDGIKVSIFRQEREPSGMWVDKPVDPQTVKDLENAILSRSRHYRSTTVK